MWWLVAVPTAVAIVAAWQALRARRHVAAVHELVVDVRVVLGEMTDILSAHIVETAEHHATVPRERG